MLTSLHTTNQQQRPPYREGGFRAGDTRTRHGGAPQRSRDATRGRKSRKPISRRERAPITSETIRGATFKKPSPMIPLPENDTIRIIPFGGVEEIGRNMVAVECRDDIVIIDAGVQFKEEQTPGIDYILPNTKYLEERVSKIRAVLITHGHLDHIGAIPYIMERIGNPPIFSRRLTTVMIQKRQEEFPHLTPLDIRVVERAERIKIGGLTAYFFAVTHTIPDSMGVILETPYGDIVHTGDLKLEHVGGIPVEKELQEFAIFDRRKVLLLMQDSTNVERPGFSIPEAVVHQNLEEVIKESTGRLIIGTFASQIERIIHIVKTSEKYNKKVVVEGRSMRQNVEIAKFLGLIKTKPGTFITPPEMDQYPPQRIIVLATGAQGDEYAALMRMGNKTNKYFKINKGDVVLLASSIVPGNERAVQKLKDNLSRQGAKIIHKENMDVHASGHANREETMWIHKRINPRFFIPVHGYHYMLRVHADIAEECGVPTENIVVPNNGMIIEIKRGEKIVARKETAPSSLVLVDGFAIGDTQEVVLRDRQALAEDGMFVIVASINPKTGRLRKSPDIISRGFIYLRESQDLLSQTRLIIKKTVEDVAGGMQPINFDYIKGALTDAVAKFLFQKTNKHPMIIPVLIGV